MAGVDPRAPWKWAEVNGQKHWYGVSLAERLGGVLKQRMMDAERHGVETIPIQSHLSVSPGDVVPFLYACTDDEKIEELLWGFSLIKWSLKDDLAMIRTQWRGGLETLPIPRCWALLKLLYIPEKVRDVSIRSEPRTMYLLQAGRLKEAVDIARRRLFVSRLDPLPVTHDDSMDPIRLLAGLIIPVTKKNLLESLVLKKKSETT
jgi:CRISPR-associated protein Csx17